MLFFVSTATAAASILLNTLDAGKAPLVRKKTDGFGDSAALPHRSDFVPKRSVRSCGLPSARFKVRYLAGRALPNLPGLAGFGVSFGCLGFFFSLRRSLFPMVAFPY